MWISPPRKGNRQKIHIQNWWILKYHFQRPASLQISEYYRYKVNITHDNENISNLRIPLNKKQMKPLGHTHTDPLTQWALNVLCRQTPFVYKCVCKALWNWKLHSHGEIPTKIMCSVHAVHWILVDATVGCFFLPLVSLVRLCVLHSAI